MRDEHSSNIFLGTLGLCLGGKSLRAEEPDVMCTDCVMRPWPTNRGHLMEEILHAFQPPALPPPLVAHRLEWRRYIPEGDPPYPTVVVLHQGGFHTGSPFGRLIDMMVAPDLQAAGYYVLIPSYRLAPCGLITNQDCHDNTPEGKASGRPPQQSDDVKAIIRAARADPFCLNQKVGVVGGSAGATHAIWVALDTNSSGNAWPFWTKDDRADVVACLSGAYLFSDRTTESYIPAMDFTQIITNYTGTTDLQIQESLSPTKLVKPPSEQFPLKPIFLINSERDSLPYHQIVDMQNALESNGIHMPSYKLITIPHSSEHAFEYWDSSDGQPTPQAIKKDVMDYLKAVLNP